MSDSRAKALAQLAVVIPLGPAEDAHPGLLHQLAALPGGAEIRLATCSDLEFPVDLRDALRHLRCEVVRGTCGRAAQLNRGVRATTARWLWLLHADSRIDHQTLAALAAFIADDGDAIGWFDLAFADDGPWLTRINAWGANRRSHWFGLPFGDQGLVMKRELFERLGGFDETASCGEDLVLMRKARRLGVATRALGARISSSARRYREHGWLRTTLRNLWLTVALTVGSRAR